MRHRQRPMSADRRSDVRPGARASRTRCARRRATASGRCCCAPSRRRSRCCSTSCCASTRARARAVRIVTIDTGVLFEETLQTWRAFEERFGVKIEVVRTRAARTQPWSGPEHCCSVAKVAALERALDGAEGWITGIRREQGPTRADDRADRTRREARPVEVQPAGALDRQGPVAAHPRARPAVQPAARPGLRVDRLRAVHPARQRPRGPLGGHREDRVRACTSRSIDVELMSRRGAPPAEPPARARVRGDPRDARGRRRIRAPGAAVQRRQGLDRAAAPGREGVPPGAVPVPADARRHRAQLPRGDRVPRPPRGRARRAADRGERAGVDRQRPRRRGDRARARRATGCRR